MNEQTLYFLVFLTGTDAGAILRECRVGCPKVAARHSILH
jgi:hypothetical protein